MKRGGLGRGLDVLLPQSGELLETVVRDISIDEIDPNASQPRRDFDKEALEQLADSIREAGVLSPILVVENGMRYRIVAGERRYRAARLAGLEYYIVMEGYRSVEAQEELFNAEMESLSSRYSGNTLIEETKKKVNYPGNSDYHTGMSFRMDVYQRDNAELNNLKFQAESEQGAWLTENCWRFGIIFRFPTADFPKGWEDKSYKTGVSAQLNLYRYVGKAHSAAMRVMDMCLEEYIEFLIAHPHICVYEDGALKYEIVRIKIADDAQSVQLPVPNPASSYLASLDNMGGVVMAYTY